jgi:RNA polymerase sigma-70 factor (ECF subfamily)
MANDSNNISPSLNADQLAQYEKELTDPSLIKQLAKQAYSLTRNSEDAKELMNETLLRAWKGITRGMFTKDDDNSIKKWLYVIMLNIHRDNKKPLPTCELSDDMIGLNNAVAPFQEAYVLAHELNAKIAAMPESFRIALNATMAGESQETAASMFGVGAGTIKSGTHRARKKLAAILSDNVEGQSVSSLRR